MVIVMVGVMVKVRVSVTVRSMVRLGSVRLGHGKFRVRVCVRVSLGPRVWIIVRVRISVMVRVSTTHNF